MRKVISLALLPGVTSLSLLLPVHFSTTVKVLRSDPVERHIYAQGKYFNYFWFSFRTVYKINVKPVSPARFWRDPLVGKTLQLRSEKRDGFWFVRAANLLEKTNESTQ